MDVVGKPITTLAEQVAPRVVEGSKATVIPPRSKPLIFFYNLGAFLCFVLGWRSDASRLV